VSLLRGDDDTRVRATWRAVGSFAAFFAVQMGATAALKPLPWPDVLLNAPGALPALLGVAVVLGISERLFGVRPRDAYGLDVDRRWVEDLLAGIALGCLFQGLVTVLMLQFGTGQVTAGYTPGVASGRAAAVVAFGATTVAFLGVALWEELLFRAVLIRNAAEGFVARGASRGAATGGAVLLSALVFGPPHALGAADDGSASFFGLQAVVAGLYFGLAYVLTDGIALPIGLHLSTNVWFVSVFGQTGTEFPALFRLERTLELGWALLPTFLLPTVVLCLLILGWVYWTRGTLAGDGFLAAGTSEGASRRQ
jgi:membrane protease YdiL (CAAX protease family)